MMRDDSYIANLLEPFSNSDTQQCDTSQCYFTSTTPESLDWTMHTTMILILVITSKLLDSQQVVYFDKELSEINSVYRVPLKDNTIQIVIKKIVLFKPILANHQYIMLIIVPLSLRRKLFRHYHAGPSSGHVGEYKTLYRIRLRFFWPKLREDIIQ